MRLHVSPIAYIAATVFTAASSAVAATPEQAKAFSERAAAYIEQAGEEAAGLSGPISR